MRHRIAAFALLAVAWACAPVAIAATPVLAGSWEAARTPDDERLYLVLKDMGKAEIVAEYDLAIPGQPPRRSRATTFGSWALKGGEVTITYSKIKDRLRYVGEEPLAAIGLPGAAPALKPVGKPDPKSRIGTTILWKAPHDYRLKAEPSSAQPPAKQ
jgi:hypothetical protein